MKKILKQLGVSLLFLLFLNVIFYILKSFFFYGFNFYNFLVYFFVGLFSFMVFFVFVVLSFLYPFVDDNKRIKDPSLRHILYLVGAAFVFLWFGFNIYILVVFIALFLFLLISDFSVVREEKSFFRFKFEKLFARAQINIFSAFAVLIAILIFLSPKISNGEINFPIIIYNNIFPKLEAIYQKQIPGFSGEMSVDEYLFLSAINGESFKGTPLQDITKPKDYEDLKQTFNDIKTGPLAEAFQQSLAQGREQFSKTINFQVVGDEKMKDVFYKLISKQISDNFSKYKELGIFFSIFIFFLITRGIISLVGIIYMPLALLVFKIFQATGFFKLEEEEVKRQKIVI